MKTNEKRRGRKPGQKNKVTATQTEFLDSSVRRLNTKTVEDGEFEIKVPVIVNVRDVMAKQLREAGFVIDVGALSDRSGSWIEVYPKGTNLGSPKLGTLVAICISFNYEGTRIDNMRALEEKFIISKHDNNKVLF